MRQDYWPLNTTLWVKDFHGNDPHFASYLLRTVDFQSCSDKSSVPGVNRNDLHRIPVLLPPLAEQKSIAAVLGALDDKIECNRRMNATLEAMARALFLSWFVDFDPVRAKLDAPAPAETPGHMAEPSDHMAEPSSHVAKPSSHVAKPSSHVAKPSSHAAEPSSHAAEPSSHAAEPSSLVAEPSGHTVEPSSHDPRVRQSGAAFSVEDVFTPENTAALFRAAFQDSPRGKLPIGWRFASFEDVCAINDWTLSKNDDLATLEYVEISEVSRGNIANIATYPRGKEPSRARRRLRHGDTVLSTVRPDRGSHFLALNPPENRVASTGFAMLTPTKAPWSFLHAALTMPEVSDHLGQMAAGGAYPAVRPEVIGKSQSFTRSRTGSEKETPRLAQQIRRNSHGFGDRERRALADPARAGKRPGTPDCRTESPHQGGKN